ncbi:hypothetical protein DMC30DRAFT_418644 [Rhodotorula diobovata]|uniref:F-box domain-containing protein n=1 Tax=Rhodotorula diobovata TaxID=5288 RepID=A0A5C5FQX0_9BASI|nr:hypothetical protein DMC30DRAFT_418644 [Rhodotorula diobovata]
MAPSLRSGKSKQAAPKQTQPSKKRPKASTTQDKGVGGLQGAPAPKKKAKTGSKASKASTQRDVFSTLPHDVLGQICRDLDPGTLLAISQVSKLVHRTIASKSAKNLWEFVRRNGGWPDMEQPLSELKYAHLAQGYVCGSSKECTEVEVALHVRACTHCFKTNLKYSKTISLGHKGLHPRSFDCALSSPYSVWGHHAWRSGPRYYWLPDVLALSDRLHSLDPGAALARERGEEYADTAAVTTFCAEHTKFIQNVRANAQAMHDAQVRVMDEELRKQDARLKKRHEQLCTKVADVGYSRDDYEGIPDWSKNTLVELTDEEWKKIGRHVLASVAKYQQRRLAKEEKRAQDKRKRQLRSLYNELTDTLAAAEHAVWPRVEVFCDLPSVVPLWKPAHAVVSPTTWSALKPTILADVRREMRTDKLYCFDLVARSLRGAGANLGRKVETALDHEPSIFVNVKNEVKGLAPLNAQLLTAVVNGVLARATALLACSACRCKLPYADMLEHLKDEHVWLAEASCEAAKPQFVALLRDCLLQAGKDEATTTRLELEELGDLGSDYLTVNRPPVQTSGRVFQLPNTTSTSLSRGSTFRVAVRDESLVSVTLDPTQVEAVQAERTKPHEKGGLTKQWP